MQLATQIVVNAIGVLVAVVALVFYYSTPASLGLDVIISMILIGSLAICIYVNTRTTRTTRTLRE